MQLILEENGETRRFRLPDGTLTVGSAEACTLTVASEDVAEVHLELQVADGQVTVVPRKGVAPVKLGGAPMQDTAELLPGMSIQFGSAQLSLVDPDAKPAASTKAASPKAASTKGGARAGAARSKAGASKGRSSSAGSGGSGRVQRRARAPQKKGLPTWAILAMAAPLIFVGYKLFVSFSESTGERSFSAQTSHARITEALDTGDYKTAEAEFAKVDAQADLSADWLTSFRGLREKLKKQNAAGKRVTDNSGGTVFLEKQLKNYINKYLTKNGRSEARVFVKRADDFIERWPTHSDLDWVKRMRAQFATVGRMDEEPTLQDVTWEANTLTWAYPRNYKGAFQVLSDFEASASAAEAATVRGLISTYKTDEKEYFDERLDLAAGVYEDGAKGKALGYCVELVKGIHDPDMENDAARRITKMAGVESALSGIKKGRPKDFEMLKKNAILKAYFQEIGLL